MNIEIAKTAGFCFGVERAIGKVYEQIETNTLNNKIYTYGPIIHNEEVIKDLKEKGISVLHSKEELLGIDEGVVIIRSHGVSKDIYDIIDTKELTIVDATCPYVKKIHRIVQRASEQGSRILIAGDEKHPEVEGIKGWSKTPVTVIRTIEDAKKLALLQNEKVCMVSQTTFNYNKFQELVVIISKRGYDISVLNTICNATKERQEEAMNIAKNVDAMIVIGDKHSSNTQKLFEICKKACKYTYYIQTLGDLDMNQLGSVEKVGITAGASTPNNIIEEVQNNVRINF